MEYTKEINKYVSDIFLCNKFMPFEIVSSEKYLFIDIDIDKPKNDYICIHLDRNMDSKSIFYFKDGCPGGNYIMSKQLKYQLLFFLKKRKVI